MVPITRISKAQTEERGELTIQTDDNPHKEGGESEGEREYENEDNH